MLNLAIKNKLNSKIEYCKYLCYEAYSWLELLDSYHRAIDNTRSFGRLQGKPFKQEFTNLRLRR